MPNDKIFKDYTWRVSGAHGYMFSCVRHAKPLVGELIVGAGRTWKVIDVGELQEETYYDLTVR